MGDAKENIAPGNKKFAITNIKKIKQKLLFPVLPQETSLLLGPSQTN